MRGSVSLNGVAVFALLVEGEAGLRLRLSVDDFDRLGLVEGQRVKLATPRRGEEELLLLAASRRPPFVWLDLEPLTGG